MTAIVFPNVSGHEIDFVQIPLKPDYHFTWKNLTVFNTLPSSSAAELIEIGLSSDPWYLSRLDAETRDRVVSDCIFFKPHNFAMTNGMIKVTMVLERKCLSEFVDIFYSSTDAGQLPIWMKLEASYGGTVFTDNQSPPNRVLHDKHKSEVTFLLLHFCVFVVVERGVATRCKELDFKVFVKRSQTDSTKFLLKVLSGCDRIKMMNIGYLMYTCTVHNK